MPSARGMAMSLSTGHFTCTNITILALLGGSAGQCSRKYVIKMVTSNSRSVASSLHVCGHGSFLARRLVIACHSVLSLVNDTLC